MPVAQIFSLLEKNISGSISAHTSANSRMRASHRPDRNIALKPAQMSEPLSLSGLLVETFQIFGSCHNCFVSDTYSPG
jgi:hypothetical protein